MKKNILIVLGNPDKESFCGALADEYEKGAEEAGAIVHRLNLGELKFDPILWKGYKVIQKLEPDLIKAQKEIKWANHLVFIHPVWWGYMPALMKGFFDRVLLPGFGFHLEKGAKKQEKLLKGRTARLIVTVGTYSFIYQLFDWLAEKVMDGGIMSFCGIKPTGTSVFGPAENMKEKTSAKWLKKVFEMGKAWR